MKRIICMMLIFSSISVFSQKEMEVVSFKQSTSDISARTNQREDPKGEACALVKVQLPIRNALFDGDIIGEIAYRTNEYWVYMPQKSSKLQIMVQDCKPLMVDFINYDISSLESKGTYELCVIRKEASSPQLYNEGMIALAKNDMVTAFEKLEKASDAGYAPAAYELGQASLIPYDRDYDDDPNSAESYQEAYNYYKKAAEGGSPEAQFALAKMLKDYQDEYPEELSKIKVDPAFLEESKIWNLINSAADKGLVDAQYQMLSDDKWCEENANKGNAVAQFGMGLRNDSELSEEEFWMLESVDVSSSENFEKAAEWYQKAAENGLDAAQWRLGEMYARGLGVEKNMNKAIELRSKAAEQGNIMFQFMTGIMYALGGFSDYSTYAFPDGFHYKINIPQDTEKADKWLRKLIHRQLNKTEMERIDINGLFGLALGKLADGFIKQSKYDKAIYWYQYNGAFCNLGKMYFEGKGVTKDYQKARALFEKAIGDGYGDEAKAYLGVIYRDGLGVVADRNKAIDFFMSSIKECAWNCMSLYELGNLYYDEAKYEDALRYYREAKSYSFDEVQDGKYVWLNEFSTKACYKLGLMYLNGAGIDIDKGKAVDYISKAAYRGNQDAKVKLKELGFPENWGEILHYYELGKDKYNHREYDQAVKMFGFSAEQGYAPAQYYLGRCYDKGRGVSENKQEAIKWYRLAAEQDVTEAQFNLGYSYIMGNGVPIDYSEGIKWTRLAAEKGDPIAQYNMGWCCENGKGVPKNYSEAVKWYELAAKQGYQHAIKKISDINAIIR